MKRGNKSLRKEERKVSDVNTSTKSAQKAELRAATYAGITDYLTSVGDQVEPSVNGILVWDPDRELWFEVSVVVKDERTFDLNKARADYAEKASKAAERAAAAKTRAEEKAKRAEERAAKAKKNIEEMK